MINPNALPQSATVQDFQNLESALDSPDYNNTLQAMRYMQGQRTGGLNRLPQVTVPMQEGGMMEEAITEKQDMEPAEAMLMEQVEQQLGRLQAGMFQHCMNIKQGNMTMMNFASI